MKYYSFIFSLLFFFSLFQLNAQTYSKWELVFNEQFDNNNHNWHNENSPKRKTSIISGKLMDFNNSEEDFLMNLAEINF